MSLAHELHETNVLLREAVKAPEQEWPVIGPPLRPAPFHLAAVLALREHLKHVPRDYWRIRPSGDVTIACVCRTAIRMQPGFMECSGCDRTFAFTGRRVLAMRHDD